METLKRYAFFIPVAALFAAIGQAIGSDSPIAMGLLIACPLVLGAIFGAIAGLGWISDNKGWTYRIGTVVILFAGGTAAFGPADKAKVIVPWLSVGALLGFVILLAYLSMSGDDDDDDSDDGDVDEDDPRLVRVRNG